MPPSHRKFEFITGPSFPVEHDQRRAKIRKGAFLITEPRADNATLIKSFPEFEDSIKAAGPVSGPIFEREQTAIKELVRRLELVRQTLKATRK
jgi:hypothetical protein